MNEWLEKFWDNAPEGSALDLAARLAISLVAGFSVAFIYRWTRKDEGSAHLPATLVFLAILISAVTQVIGDNVARAFSLVGALSIVRFRTVVRDTRDTAFVIFAVVVGMAVGAGRLVVAFEAILAIVLAAWLLQSRGGDLGLRRPEFDLVLRAGLGLDVDAIAQPVWKQFLSSKETVATVTAKQGAALEYTYRIRLVKGERPEALVRALNRIEGFDNVELKEVEG